MRFGSVCSGIEAASVAWMPLGFDPAWFSEIDPFCCALLKQRHPGVPNLGDMTRFKEWDNGSTVDVLVGGTPCQSFSVAGLRKGLADPRGNLTLVYLAVVDRLRPRWVVWENVPGVLSIDDGRAFGAFLGGLGKLGYGFAYRVLDAQYFGVPQRRRRVFVVGYFGDWRRAAAVLFERSSLSGNLAPSREARAGIADGALSRALSRVGGGDDPGANKGAPLIPMTAWALQERDHKGVDSDTKDGHLIPVAFKASHYTRGKDGAPSELTPPLSKEADRGDQDLLLAFDTTQITHPENEVEGNANSGGQIAVVAHTATTVRRLTPRECERLQGFPDDYTLIKHRGKPAADGPRYKALGNSFAVPVVRWIGERIKLVEEIP